MNEKALGSLMVTAIMLVIAVLPNPYDLIIVFLSLLYFIKLLLEEQ